MLMFQIDVGSDYCAMNGILSSESSLLSDILPSFLMWEWTCDVGRFWLVNYCDEICACVHSPSIHISWPDFPVYTVVFWSPAIEHSKLQPLLMKRTALTNISHHTLITPIILNNPPILIHINGDYKSPSNQGCGSGYFSNASASTPIASASASAFTASASTNKKRKNDRWQFFLTFVGL